MRYDLRPASELDREFLYSLHRTTMRQVIEETWGWDEAWQRSDFERRFDECRVSVIEADSRAVGALWLEQRPESLVIRELQVLPEMQGNGIGTGVLNTVIAMAVTKGLSVTLSVVTANPRAQSLYKRMGFKVEGVEPPFTRMRHMAGRPDN